MKTQLDDFCRVLVKTGALKFGLFTLSGGKLSPYYLDLRILPSFPDAFQKSVELLVENAKKIVGVDKIAGIPTGGLPWASVLAFSLSKPLVYTRKDVKTHGRGRKEEGGKSHLEASGVELHSVVRISEVAQKLLDMDAITKTQYGELTGQHDSGEAYSIRIHSQ